MKKLALLLILIIFTVGCQNEESINPQKGFIQFSFLGNSGGKVGETPEPASVLLSLEDADGNVIEKDKKIPLYSFGSGYVSESLQLTTGNYKLTEFMVLDGNNIVIYATPIEGSELADLVADPLPIAFSVEENGTTLVTPQVLAITDSNTPEIFGYVSFGFEVVNSVDPTLKTMMSYSYSNECACYLPSSKVVFTYNENKQVSVIDVYGNFDYNGYKHNWSHSIEYFPIQSSLKETTWLVPDNSIQSITEILFDEEKRIKSTKTYSGNNELLWEDSYAYFNGGYAVTRKIYQYNGWVIIKTEYETSNGNIMKEKHYDVNGNPNGEETYLYDNKMNPLADFYPFLILSESKNNRTVKKAAPDYQENYVNTYSPAGLLSETVMNATNGVSEKRVFNYY